MPGFFFHKILRWPVRVFRPAFFLVALLAISCAEDLPIEPEESEFSEAGIKFNADAVTFEPTVLGRSDTFTLSIEYGDTVNMTLLMSLDDAVHFTVSPDSFAFSKTKKLLDVSLTYTPTTINQADLGNLILVTLNPPDTLTGIIDTVGVDTLRLSGAGSGQFLDLELIFVGGGTFGMGIDSISAFENVDRFDQWGEHSVVLSDFFIGRYEVTNLQYYEFWSEVKPAHTPRDSSVTGSWPQAALLKPNFPVVGVNWDDASAFCRWLSLRTGERYTLPTEAQWQYTACGGQDRQYPWSVTGDSEEPADTLNPGPLANTLMGGDGYTYTAPVDVFTAGASAFGPLNMAGNVWEWCLDWYDPDYYRADYETWVDPQGTLIPDHFVFKVVRGGSWFESISQAGCAHRSALSPENKELNIGFRVVRLP
jgi:formylglycine-generating enzyme required for sulfatase activity